METMEGLCCGDGGTWRILDTFEFEFFLGYTSQHRKYEHLNIFAMAAVNHAGSSNYSTSDVQEQL
jgi:hypothetical protein